MIIVVAAACLLAPLLLIIAGIVVYELRKQRNRHELEMAQLAAAKAAPAKTEVKD